MCVYKKGKCLDQETKDIDPKTCIMLSSFMGMFAQYDGVSCRDCEGSYPKALLNVYPLN